MNDIQRAIDQLNDLFDHCNSMIEEPESIWREDCDAIKTAISAMQELQQYRQTGASPERCKELICERSAAKRILGHYEAIGTLEECREAMERRKAKKPVIGADFLVGRDDNGEPVWDSDYACPDCGMGIAGEYICCPYCGQTIDWSKEENDGEINLG